MRAVAFDSYGDESVLKERQLPEPLPGPGQVLVRVAATSVNPADWRLRSGQFRWVLRLRFPFVPGADISGTIAALGPDVEDVAVGDPVVACTPPREGGGSAEYALVRRDHLAPAPRVTPLIEAAALPLCGLTALQALDQMPELNGRSLLLIGATGGVGTLALQLAAARGAHVTAYARGQASDDLRSLGAHDVLAREDIPLRAKTLRGAFDLVLDAANAQSLRRTARLLRPAGCAVTVNPFAGRLHPDALAPMRGGRKLQSVLVEPNGSQLNELCRLVDAQSVRPVVQRVLSLEDLAHAQRLVAAGGSYGKTVIEISPPS